jgi:hypothetical protein
MMTSKSAPVLMHIFNRPKMVADLLKRVRLARPEKLYISSDGPRPAHPQDDELVYENRKIVEQVDWDCEVKTLFQEKNLGTRYALVAAIDWFFSNETEGIILEEDCLPNQSFFRFCTELLGFYRDDRRVMHIAGINQQFGKKIGKASYYFSSFPPIWGWASWRRVWRLYDVKMELLPEFIKQNAAQNIYNDPFIADHINKFLLQTYENRNMTWDHQLGFAIAINNGLCIVPNVNLVSNIGVKKIGNKQLDSVVANIPTVEIEGELIHPQFFIPDKKADINHMTWTYEDTSTEKKVLHNGRSFWFDRKG